MLRLHGGPNLGKPCECFCLARSGPREDLVGRLAFNPVEEQGYIGTHKSDSTQLIHPSSVRELPVPAFEHSTGEHTELSGVRARYGDACGWKAWWQRGLPARRPSSKIFLGHPFLQPFLVARRVTSLGIGADQPASELAEQCLGAFRIQKE